MKQGGYIWRKLTANQREELLAWRKDNGLPWHRPPHRASERTRYHVIAACFEHRPYIGPFSSAEEYLANVGRDFAEERWKSYPIKEYGKGWDEAAL